MTVGAYYMKVFDMNQHKLLQILVLSVVLLPLAVSASASATAYNGQLKDHPPSPAIISVRGEGTVSAAPDTATITLGVTSGDKDLRTSSLRLHPRYNYDRQGESEKVKGYRASSHLTIRIRDIEKTGTVLDKAVSIGINHVIDNICFSISDPNDILQKARRKAVHDAKTKAETIVSELGCRLGRISCISTESGHSYPMPPMQMQQQMSRSVGFSQHSTSPLPTIATGENSYKVSVDITWEIIQTTSEL
eukprot:scaffold2365_cov77-Skeletonema_dohrnii-CCMP3373.AAC.22